MYKTITVDIDFEEFETEDLLEELERRKVFGSNDIMALINRIYEKRRLGIDFNDELNLLIYNSIGKIA